MSELISGKEAMQKALDGDVVLFKPKQGMSVGVFNNELWSVDDLTSGSYDFWIKPRTITINGIEVPAPFEPKDGDAVFALDNANPDGFSSFVFDSDFFTINFGAWRTESEIKQVVAALRSIFK